MERREKLYSIVEGLFTLINIGLLTLAYSLAWFKGAFSTPFPFGGNVTVIGVYVILLYTFTSLYGGYNIGQLKRFDVISSQLLSILFVNGMTFLQISLMERSLVLSMLIPFLILSLADFVIIIIWAFIADKIYRLMYPPKEVLLIYDNSIEHNILDKLNARRDTFAIRESIDISADLGDIKEAINKSPYVILSSCNYDIKDEILKYCFEKKKPVYISPSISDLMVRGALKLELFDAPMLYCSNKGLSLSQRFFKRLMDIVISFVLIVIFSPFMLISALAIKLYDRGPVLFKQERYTKGGKTFNILKFRSMVVGAEKDGQVIPATDKDPRITPVGIILRKIRMDEVPQLLNILKGDMSLVGPRPERVEHVDSYSQELPEFLYRLKVKGGLTGYAQVLGKYNTSPYDKLRLDLIYIENYSLLLDLKLLFTTFKVLFKPESTEGFPKE